MMPKYDAMTAAKMMRAFVPISMLNKGGAGKIIEEVKRDGIRVIVKNNAPECVMISVEEYDNYVKERSIPKIIPQTKEAQEKRKAFIQKIRQNVPPPHRHVAGGIRPHLPQRQNPFRRKITPRNVPLRSLARSRVCPRQFRPTRVTPAGSDQRRAA